MRKKIRLEPVPIYAHIRYLGEADIQLSDRMYLSVTDVLAWSKIPSAALLVHKVLCDRISQQQYMNINGHSQVTQGFQQNKSLFQSSFLILI